jgi:release factor glutamine methyltransferase
MLEAVREELEKASVIADIGTGSGAVGLSAAYEFPGTYAVCSDISAKALSYAESNRRRYSLDNVLLARGYLLEPFGREVFDVIFANLPYVRDEERNALAPEVIKHEPHSALFADDDGLFLIEKFIDTAADALNAGGTAVIEFGEGQAKRILRKVASLCCYNPCRILDDYSGRERFCIIRKI